MKRFRKITFLITLLSLSACAVTSKNVRLQKRGMEIRSGAVTLQEHFRIVASTVTESESKNKGNSAISSVTASTKTTFNLLAQQLPKQSNRATQVLVSTSNIVVSTAPTTRGTLRVKPGTQTSVNSSKSQPQTTNATFDIRLVSFSHLSGPDPTFRLGGIYSYPNPAVGYQKPIIHVECGIADTIEIRIYDVAGDKVHEIKLVAQPQIINDKYAYEYTWDTSQIASGVYICVVVAKKISETDLIATKKMAVVK